MSQGYDVASVEKMRAADIAALLNNLTSRRIKESNRALVLTNALKSVIAAADEFESNHISCSRPRDGHEALLRALNAAHEAMGMPL
jgi:hypothetical protein